MSGQLDNFWACAGLRFLRGAARCGPFRRVPARSIALTAKLNRPAQLELLLAPQPLQWRHFDPTLAPKCA